MSKHKLPPVGICSIAGCLLVQLCVGILYVWSIFKTPMAESFGCSPDTLSMVSSYMLSAFVAGSFLGGLLNDRKGPQLTCRLGIQLFSAGIVATAWLNPGTIGLINLTYALMGGLGSGLAYTACISCVQKWLPHRRGLATGMTVAAFGLSSVVFVPLSRKIMSLFTSGVTGVIDFRGVFSTLALIFLSVGLLSCILIRLPGEEGRQSAQTVSEGSLNLAQAVRTTSFWCIFFTVFFINGTWNLAVPTLYDLGLERGLSAAAATFAVSFTGIPNSAGRFIMASVSDRIGRRSTLRILSLVTAAAALLMIVAKGWAYIAVVSLIAFAYGGPSSVNAAITTDYFGPRYCGTNYGIIMLALGLSSLFFNFLSAHVLNGSVTLSFIVASVSALLTLPLMRWIGDPPAVAASAHGPVSVPVPQGRN